MAKKSTKKKSGCKRVSRAAARRKSGPNKGRLKPGCRYLKGDGAQCCPPGTSKASRKKSKSKSKRTSKRKSSRKKGTAPNTPNLSILNSWRRAWASAGTCAEKKQALARIKQQFRYMQRNPVNQKKGESEMDARNRRWNRWSAEYNNKARMTTASCMGARARDVPRMVTEMTVDGIGGHPCARPNPPAWCKK